jgi:hypothetical protein
MSMFPDPPKDWQPKVKAPPKKAPKKASGPSIHISAFSKGILRTASGTAVVKVPPITDPAFTEITEATAKLREEQMKRIEAAWNREVMRGMTKGSGTTYTWYDETSDFKKTPSKVTKKATKKEEPKQSVSDKLKAVMFHKQSKICSHGSLASSCRKCK